MVYLTLKIETQAQNTDISITPKLKLSMLMFSSTLRTQTQYVDADNHTTKCKLGMLMLSITPQTQTQYVDALNHLTLSCDESNQWQQMSFLFDIRENSMLSSGTFIFQLSIERRLEKSQCYKTKYYKKNVQNKNAFQSKAAHPLM